MGYKVNELIELGAKRLVYLKQDLTEEELAKKAEIEVVKGDFLTYKRGTGKKNISHRTTAVYKFYKNNLPGNYTKTDYNITGKVYSQIIRRVSEILIELMIQDNFEYTLPFKMGKFHVVKKKVIYKLDEEGNLIRRGLPVDYAATKKLWLEDSEAKAKRIKIYHTNDHTDGYKYSFFWDKKGITLRPFFYYNFKPNRKNNRYLAKCIKENPELEFFEYKDQYKRVK